jgi:hypothetical protein
LLQFENTPKRLYIKVRTGCKRILKNFLKNRSFLPKNLPDFRETDFMALKISLNGEKIIRNTNPKSRRMPLTAASPTRIANTPKEK